MSQDQQQPATVSVQDLDQFVKILTAWHQDQCAKVQYMLQVPEGTTFEIGDEELVLDGTTLAGFKFGLEMAMMQLGKLPFVAELDDAPELASAQG